MRKDLIDEHINTILKGIPVDVVETLEESVTELRNLLNEDFTTFQTITQERDSIVSERDNTAKALQEMKVKYYNKFIGNDDDGEEIEEVVKKDEPKPTPTLEELFGQKI